MGATEASCRISCWSLTATPSSERLCGGCAWFPPASSAGRPLRTRRCIYDIVFNERIQVVPLGQVEITLQDILDRLSDREFGITGRKPVYPAGIILVHSQILELSRKRIPVLILLPFTGGLCRRGWGGYFIFFLFYTVYFREFVRFFAKFLFSGEQCAYASHGLPDFLPILRKGGRRSAFMCRGACCSQVACGMVADSGDGSVSSRRMLSGMPGLRWMAFADAYIQFLYLLTGQNLFVLPQFFVEKGPVRRSSR